MPRYPSVLIVEDNEGHRFLMEDQFRSEFPKAEILNARTLREASEMLPRKRWDLVIMDWELSNGKGSGFLDEISLRHPFAAVQVLTENPVENSSDELPELSNHQGAVEFLTKDRKTFDSFMTHIKGLLKTSRRIHQLFEVGIGSRPDLPFRDPLTAVYTRAYFDETLHREVSRADRYGQEFSLLIVTIDHFKKINLQKGPPSGDRCLKKLASVITRSVRSGDVVARYGPDEFIILLSQCQRSLGVGCATRILETVKKNCRSARSAESSRFTVSIGVLHYRGTQKVLRPEEIVLRAERTVRHAKSLGGNRYQVAA